MPKEPPYVPTIGLQEVLTLEYCPVCDRKTMRRVYDDGQGGVKYGECMGCDPNCKTKAQQKTAEKRQAEKRQPSLF